ncbi:MAG: acetate--CoA ligase family protein [Rubellimicrobium sp.]|nr:acetate--CoA ligase family protein [Rubellimicrobium sp.]
MSRLDRLLRPRHIAVLGAGWAVNVVEQSRRMGFAGDIWPVHPTRDQIGGVRAYRSLADLPQPPDATFIGVNRHATIDVVRELAGMGAGGAVCFAAGWSEAGDAGLQDRLVAAAGAMPILGPNCYGVINYLDGALLWPDQHGGVRVDRGVALISQSSNIVINLGMQRRGLPVAAVACLGNAAVVGLAELTSAFLDDPRITAAGFYIEGIDDAAAFAALAQKARAMGKGLVAIKSGKTEASRAAAASHTAALAGGGAASSAFLRRIGVAEVNTPAELIETLKLMHVHGPRIGTRLCSLSCSGGEAGLMADMGQPEGLSFPPLPQATRDRLAAVLGPLVALSNPLDYNTFIWGDEDKTTEVFTATLDAYDAGFFLLDLPREDRCDASSYLPALRALHNAQRTTGKPALQLVSLPENLSEDRAAAMIADGLCPLMGMAEGLAAVRAAQAPPGEDGWRPLAPAQVAGARLLDEATGKAWLAAQGVPVPRGVVAPTLEALREAAAGLTAPLVLKGLGIAHKSEAGAVRLGLTTLDGQADMPGVTGYLAEEMVAGAVAEVLVGLRRDPVYGATLTLGLGGVTAELLADTATVVLPVDEAAIMDALRSLRLWPLLDGYRGRVRADVAALVALVLRLAQAMQDDPQLEEVEINPVLLRETGAVAVDALIRRA